MTVEHIRLAHPQVGSVSWRDAGSIRTAPPLLGEHTDEILAELGYAGEIAACGQRRGLTSTSVLTVLVVRT